MPMNQLLHTDFIVLEAYDWLKANYGPYHNSLPTDGPSLDHCVGTKRLLGSLYGIYLRDWASIKNSTFWLEITKLWMCLRSDVVLYDYIRDTSLHGEHLKNTQAARDKIVELSFKSATEILGSSEEAKEMIGRSLQKMYDAYKELTNGKRPCLELIVAKCNHVRLPLEILSRLDQGFPGSTIDRAMSEYLFSLQCLDDYYDMREDYFGVTNHNLFVWGTSTTLYDRLHSLRLELVPYVARYVSLNLVHLLQLIRPMKSHQGLFSKLIEASIHFLDTWSTHSSNSVPDALWCDSVPYECYIPPAICVDVVAEVLSNIPSLNSTTVSIDSFRAEVMHSLSANFV